MRHWWLRPPSWELVLQRDSKLSSVHGQFGQQKMRSTKTLEGWRAHYCEPFWMNGSSGGKAGDVRCWKGCRVCRATKQGLWTANGFNSARWQLNFISTQPDANGATMQAYFASSAVEKSVLFSMAHKYVQVVRQKYPKDSNEWWNHRENDLHRKSFDLAHRSTKYGLRVRCLKSPRWVADCLETNATSGNAGGTTPLQDGFTTRSVECKPGTATDLKRPHRDEFYWTARISKYTESGQGVHALRMLKKMQENGVKPSSYTYVAALKACGSLRDLGSAKQIHASAIKWGFGTDVYVGNMLIDVYAKCRSLVDAKDVFDNMPNRDVVSWNAMILGYVQLEKGKEALQLYAQMQQNGVQPDARTVVGALKACSSLASCQEKKGGDRKCDRKWCLEQVRDIHTYIIKEGFESAVFVGTMLVDVYAKCGSLVDARHFFDLMPHRNVVSWTAMILGYAQSENGEEALQLFARMQLEGVVPNNRTYVAALKACCSLAAVYEDGERACLLLRKKCFEQARAIHSHMVRSKHESSLHADTMLVDVYAKCGRLAEARQIFDGMQHRDVVSWNAMMLGYAHMDEGEKALELYARMLQERVTPNARAFMAVLKAYSSLATVEDGEEGDRANVSNKYLAQVEIIHADILKSGYRLDVILGTTLVDAYAKCGSVQSARHVFEAIHPRDVVCWNTMILGYAQIDDGEEALRLYSRMREEGVEADNRTHVAALKACSSLATLERAKKCDREFAESGCLQRVRFIHTDILKTRSTSSMFVENMLVDVYSKCGRMVEARHVFEMMAHRNVVSWTALILGYALEEEGEEAIQLFARMKQEGVSPNDRTFVAVLKACSSIFERSNGDGSMGKEECLEHVRAIHSEITTSGFESDVFVGTMLVDVYAKSGSLIGARHIFENMPRRNVVSWTSMILGYAQREEGQKALELYNRMQHEGVAPDERTYVAALRACTSLVTSGEESQGEGVILKRLCLDNVRSIHSHVVRSGAGSGLFVGNMLVDAYAKCGSVVDARHVFEKMTVRNVVSWNAMILGYTQADGGLVALQLYDRMQREGVIPDDRTFVCALQACGAVAGLDKGKEIHREVLKTGLDKTGSFVPTALIDMYASCGRMDTAQEVFDALPVRSTATWNALITGYARQGQSGVVFQSFDRMGQEGTQPDGITFLTLLTACNYAGLVSKGQLYFGAMSTTYGIKPSVEHFNCLVDLLARAGEVDKAFEVAELMPFRTPGKVWRSILAACQKWGNVQLGRQAFGRAVQVDSKDAAAYVLMANIYSAAGMEEEAREMQAIRVKLNAWKRPGQSWWTDVEGVVHTFAAGRRDDSECKDAYL